MRDSAIERLAPAVRALATAAALLTATAVPAYDLRKVEVAIETLTPQTQRDWESKAKRGDALAQNVTGMAYKYGIGVEQSHPASLRWFRMAAERRDADAQFNLARALDGQPDGMYRRVRAAPADDAEAFEWYRRSAEQGHTPAQVKLAEMYLRTAAAWRDPVQARKWFAIAAQAGDDAAAKRLESTSAGLAPDQVAQADRLAAEWQRGRGQRSN